MNLSGIDPRERWQYRPGHETHATTRLAPGERAQRDWTCSCGQFKFRGFDNGARVAFRAHVAEVEVPA